MNTVEGHSTATVEVKQSKFIAHLVPISEYAGLQEKLRDAHPKSRHVVYALRSLNEYDQIVENSSDDGEPKGSSGVPALNVLRGEELINTAVLIVRYFGGTKLGTGGLVRAYSESTNMVAKQAKLLEYKKLEQRVIYCRYSDASKIEYLLQQRSIAIEQKTFQTSGIKMVLNGTIEGLKDFLTQADRLASLQE
jgi:uncharacterized YigZ family protein